MLILKKLTLMLILGLIKIYQVIVSPLCGGCCRFSPTCSAYARQAFLLHGVVKGGKLMVIDCYLGAPDSAQVLNAK